MLLAADLDLPQAADRIWDAIVVGAGPAGALAARELARRGAAVLLVDKASFPRPKVCGCCLNRSVASTLAQVGLGSLIQEHGGVRLHSMELAAWGRRAVIALPWETSLSRTVFDAALVRAAQAAGASLLPQTMARLGAAQPHARAVVLQRGAVESTALARVVLAADGLAGSFRAGQHAPRAAVTADSFLGAGAIAEDYPPLYREPRIFMACGSDGYVGLVQLEDGRLNLATALSPAKVKNAGGPGRAVAALLQQAGLPVLPNLDRLAWHGTPLLTRRVPRLTLERVFCIGDAAGYVEPFTGEGMAWALASAVAVTPLAWRACQSGSAWDPALERCWARQHAQRVGRRQWLCRAVATVLRQPTWVRILVAVLGRAPILAAPVVAYFNASALPVGVGCQS